MAVFINNFSFYSYLSDSIGLSLAALIAGKIPNMTPIAVEKHTAKIIGKAVIDVESPANFCSIKDIRTANRIPKIPPMTLKTILSVKNWVIISLF